MHDGFPPPRFLASEINGQFSGEIDLFVCSASYEERCLVVPKALDRKRVDRTIILQNERVQGNGEQNREILESHFGSNAETIKISKTSAIHTADRIVDLVAEYTGSAIVKCLVDITCMTHEALLMLHLVLTRFLGAQAQILFAYTPANEYDPGIQPQHKWLSKGITGVRSVLGYPGTLKPSQKTHVIVMVGFEVERTTLLLETLEPFSISFGLGDEQPIHPEHQAVNEHKYERLRGTFPSAKSFSFSPSDPLAVKASILQHIADISHKNIIIAPMNTKLSTLGVALAVRERPDIQICYAPAEMYNVENYSTASQHCMLFGLE